MRAFPQELGKINAVIEKATDSKRRKIEQQIGKAVSSKSFDNKPQPSNNVAQI